MDFHLIKWMIETTIYIASFMASSFAVKAIPFTKFLDHTKIREAWILYMLTTLLFTFCIGTLVIKCIGLDIWFN